MIDIGDVNGDGLPDHVVSRDDHGTPVATMQLAGRAGDGRGRRTASAGRELDREGFTLRGPAAAPFRCGAAGRGRLVLRRFGTRSARATGNPIGQPPAFTIVDLDPLMPAPAQGFSSVANAINALGHVVGRYATPEGDQAYLFEDGSVRSLGTLGGHVSEARGINARGHVVGYSLTGEADESGFVNAAFLFDGAALVNLQLPWSSAEAISDSGLVVGEMRVAPNASHAFVYYEGDAGSLGALPPLGNVSRSVAYALNESGQIVGESDTFITRSGGTRHAATHAFLFENGAMHDLGTLGPACFPAPGGERCLDRATATDINEQGVIVGYSTTTTGSVSAFVRQPDGALAALGTLGGASSWAYGVNDSGQVVGSSLDADGALVPFLYDDGVMYDLGALVVDGAGPLPFAAHAINNFGQIAGNHHLLTPVYETVGGGTALSFDAELGGTLAFEYWIEPGLRGRCDGRRLQLQVRVSGVRPGPWLPATGLRPCAASTDWGAAFVRVPLAAQRVRARVEIRLYEPGGRTGIRVHLRRFASDETPALDGAAAPAAPAGETLAISPPRPAVRAAVRRAMP